MINIIILTFISLIFIILLNYYFLLLCSRFLFGKYIKSFVLSLVISILGLVFIDFYIFKLFGHGYPSSVSEEAYERAPSPYDMFSGKPGYKEHNLFGFKGKNFTQPDKEVVSIAFFYNINR